MMLNFVKSSKERNLLVFEYKETNKTEHIFLKFHDFAQKKAILI